MTDKLTRSQWKLAGRCEKCGGPALWTSGLRWYPSDRPFKLNLCEICLTTLINKSDDIEYMSLSMEEFFEQEGII